MSSPINQLVRLSDILSPQFANLFHHDALNPMQSAVSHQLLHSDESMVIAAPTGCGKTLIHELAIIRQIQLRGKRLKCVVIMPNKALCQQRMSDWCNSFGSLPGLGLKVVEITGDTDGQYLKQQIARANIIVTTPEKWDASSRQLRDHVFLLGAIDLLLLDEIHHVGDDRGATLEMTVVRMKR